VTLPTPPPEQPRRRTGRRVAVAVVSVALLVLAGYAAAVYAISGDDVPEGTSVRGVNVGGMTTEEAIATLEAELGDDAATPIPVTAGEAATELDPAESGLAVDWAATVAQASGLVLDPRILWQHLQGDVALEPITTTDEQALTAALEDLASVAAREPVEPQITYTKQAVAELEAGVPGAALDVPASVDVVSAAYFQLPYSPIPLPMTQLDPTVPDDEARRVMAELAEPAVALPVTLQVAEAAKAGEEPPAPEDVEVAPADIARTLTFAPEKGTLAASLDGEELHERLADELAGIERPGRSATVVIKGGEPAVVPSRSGRAVDPEELGTEVLAVLAGTTAADRVARVTLEVSQPARTTAEAKALNITEKLSSFRQWFPPAAYRYQNVGQAAEYLNGTIIEPGETFSMNDTVKERTRANGYTEGFIISKGRFQEELGGGVSIITTATWTAGFYAGLERVEQRAHGLYISRYQAGLEATVAWGLIDLKMRNDTGNGVLITAKRYSDGVLVEMWGTKKFDKVTATFTDRYNYTDYQTITDDADKCVPSEGVRGFSISVTRRRYIGDEVVSTETWPTTYKPTPNVVCTSPNASPG
jgi:vancomycin resistance protein YoaR